MFSFSSIVGIFSADNTRLRLANLAGTFDEPLAKFTMKKYYKVDLSQQPTLGLVSRMLDIAPYVVVVKTGIYTIIRKLSIKSVLSFFFMHTLG